MGVLTAEMGVLTAEMGALTAEMGALTAEMGKREHDAAYSPSCLQRTAKGDRSPSCARDALARAG